MAIKSICRSAVLAIAGTGLCSSAFAQDLRRDLHAGSNISQDEATSLESQLIESPEDLSARARLVGHYADQRFQNDAARAKHLVHVLWFIKNAPEANLLAGPEVLIFEAFAADGYAKGKDAWSSHLENNPNNLRILKHAANFFRLHDRQLAIQILNHAQSLDQEEPEWARQLGHLHQLDIRLLDGTRDPAAAKRALAQFERAYELSDELGREAMLRYLGTSAFQSGNFEKATAYAGKMLEENVQDWNYGNRIHYGNLILGRIALLEGNIEEAKARLVAAGETPGSPQLNSFGPDMTLARELLAHGDADVVLEYLSLCSEFWELDRGDLERWIVQVRAGETPDFGGNLMF
ncbi:MAG: hypothetical protein OXN96_01045 [Bryobacterales bacterium]|nr:hypothetical protein [Bryobacterales bacterium]